MIHPLSDVRSKSIGAGTDIWQYSIVLEGARIGEGCNINCHCFIENEVVIGNDVTVKAGVYVWDGTTIQDGAFIGPNATFSNDKTPRSKRRDKEFGKTLVMEGASIGAGAIILPGITIGKFAMVGAGALVTKDVGDFELWYGSPATRRAYLCRCGEKLGDALECPSCGRSYEGRGSSGITERDRVDG
jgi:UDP-2-acetamido-3-amino-2,3-dideoxy-glucuronate N-acetyltransferase